MGTSFIGDVIKDIQDSGCSLFFFTSSALSIYNGEKNRANSWENAIKEQKFQDELLLQKEKYEDMKEAEQRKKENVPSVDTETGEVMERLANEN